MNKIKHYAIISPTMDVLRVITSDSPMTEEWRVNILTFVWDDVKPTDYTAAGIPVPLAANLAKERGYTVQEVFISLSQLSTNTDGWVSVPIEPTEEMLKALDDALREWASNIGCYRAMIEASPRFTINAISQPKGESV